jgi:hypothetical protein
VTISINVLISKMMTILKSSSLPITKMVNSLTETTSGEPVTQPAIYSEISQ